jgi:type I restriction enzyme, S subunit
MNNFVTLKSLCHKITDGSHYSPKGEKIGYPMLSVKDMTDFGFTYSDCKFISEEDYQNLVKADCKPKLNDLLIAKDGSYLKHVFVIKEEIEQAILSSIGILRPNLNKVYPDYLKYYLQTKSVKETVSKKYVSGSALPRIILKGFEQIDVLIKDLPTQKSIAKVLSDLDAKIELNNRINRELEAMAKTLYDFWFVQFDFPASTSSAAENRTLSGVETTVAEHSRSYKSSGGKMVYNAELKREIPEGWEVKKLAEIANITMGQSPEGSSYNDDGIGEIFFQGSTDFGWRYPTIRQYTTQPSRRAKAGDILLSVRAPVGTLNIADNDCCIGRGLAALNSKSGYDIYLYYVMEYFKQIFDHRNNTGTTFGSITKDDLFSLKLVYPKDDQLNKYNHLVAKYNQMILNNYKQNQQLTELRDWLLPMLMNGQVTVRQAHGNAVKEVEERLSSSAELSRSMAAEPSVEYKKG